jgi:hypothetical membrane protein
MSGLQPELPWWALVSSTSAPVMLIGGWTLAAALQPSGFDSTTETISALAGMGATDRWVMTLSLGGLGVCHLVTALGLRPAALPGRMLLGAGGAATLAVAALPLPVDGSSWRHGLAAEAAFVALAAWPALAWRRRQDLPWPLRRTVAAMAAATLLGLDGWLVVAIRNGALVGLAERVAAGAQSLWPWVVSLGCARYMRRAA